MIGSFIGAASHIIKIVSIVMGKTTDRTKLFVRFLKEKGIKYAYAEETLRFAYIKKYELKEFSRFLSDEVGGDLLKYLDSLFSQRIYNVIGVSFTWASTKNGCDFWAKIESIWLDYCLNIH